MAGYGSPVLVGLDWHSNSASTVVLMKLDGSVIATRTLPATWLVDEHAVGAYMLVANDGSGKAWTVDATGAVTDVAPAAAALLSPPANGGGWAPPLIVDSTTAVTVGWPTQASMAVYEVDLHSGGVRTLLTAPQTGVMALAPALTVLDVSADRQTVWLRRVTPTGGTSGELDIVGVDLRTGTVSSQGRADSFAGEQDLAITRDGKSVASQVEFGTDGSNLAFRHLHVISLGTKVDSDLQGAAPYVGGQRSPSVLFAPGGASVAWWGGLNNGGNAFLINVAVLGGTGQSLFRLDNPGGTHELVTVMWADPATLLVQTDTTTTPGSFAGSGLQAFTVDATSGAQKPLPAALHYVVAVLN
ncbi:MAG TPA: hypothetical protein VLK30_10500 [Candidatus Limnocylindrales bacterium]|nr:hypothetical protein [Candidatus Limnocylindrales bacterium]